MGGAAYVIYGDLNPSRLDPLPRKQSLIDKLLGRQFFDETKSTDQGRCTMTEVPPGDMARRLTDAFESFLKARMTDFWPATRTALDYLKSISPKVYLRGEKRDGADETDWYVQLTFKGCAGMAEVSAQLAYHWAEIWVQHDIQKITEEILVPEGFTPKLKLEIDENPGIFIPVGDARYALYASVWMDDGGVPSFELDQSNLEGREDDGEGLLEEVQDRLGSLVADGKCRCQLCMPDYKPDQLISF